MLSTGELESVALLAMALHDRGVAATSLTGPQAGMKTTGRYGSGMISEIRPDRLRGLLDKGQDLPLVEQATQAIWSNLRDNP